MFRVLPYCVCFIYPFLILLTARGGWFLLSVPIFSNVLVPILDNLLGVNEWNPNSDEEAQLRSNWLYRAILWLWVPVQLWMLLFGLAWVIEPGRTVVDLIGMSVAVGLSIGIVGITFAHELSHRPNKLENYLGEALTGMVSYSHVGIEHVQGHHRYVATPEDPVTARFNENFYHFYWRSLIGGYLTSWPLEAQRLRKLGKNPWGPENRMIRYTITHLLIYGFFYWAGGLIGLAYFFLQAYVAMSILQTANYLQHYGLMRKEIAPGQFERTRPVHAWSSGHKFTNWLLVNLPRHADHHEVASKPYQVLQNDLERSPQLPYGYGTMIGIAMIPPLWFKMMNPIVLRWREIDETRPANARLAPPAVP